MTERTVGVASEATEVLLPSPLQEASERIADILADVEPTPIVISSYELALRTFQDSFEAGEIWVAHIADVDDGIFRALWHEKMDHAGNDVGFDCLWSLKDPNIRLVETQTFYYNGRPIEEPPSSGYRPMHINHMLHLNSVLRRFQGSE